MVLDVWLRAYKLQIVSFNAKRIRHKLEGRNPYAALFMGRTGIAFLSFSNLPLLDSVFL